MKTRHAPGLLDLRLLFSQQPGLLWLLCLLFIALAWVWAHPHAAETAGNSLTIDPARLAAARHNFRNLLIPRAELATMQQALLDRAAQHQLSVGQVDYSQETDTAGGFTSASMRLSVSGRYADIHRFIESQLASQPALAIRYLSIQRDASGEANPRVSANLTAQFLVGEAGR